MTLNTGAGRPR